MSEPSITYRDTVADTDPASVRAITQSSGFFYPDEIDTAVELVEERLAKGLKSGYHFIFAEENGRTVGYSCFGPIACTKSSFDHYWLAVVNDARGRGLGTALIGATERAIAGLGGTRIYLETSSRPLYDPTRAFYAARAYTLEAELRDFYGPGDAKVIYVKVL
ncbi:MAG: GNAT family N-acetyltransferase [Spirochaetes bacterium]|nr:GNAT family N-acetyltransferase [Spirochaetota bacterium]